MEGDYLMGADLLNGTHASIAGIWVKRCPIHVSLVGCMYGHGRCPSTTERGVGGTCS